MRGISISNASIDPWGRLTENTDVLIVGAGPTGLVLALWLTRLGIRVRIIDKNSEPGTTSRALAVQARTLELYRQIGLADAVLSRGRKMTTINLWKRGKHVSHVVFGEMGKDLSPFPYALIYPQDEHERLLIDRLAEAGVQVERQTELVTFEETAAGVRACLQRADGGTDTCEAAYLAGCDGARSTVREGLADRFSRRHVPPSLLCRRRRRTRPGDERRTARRTGHDRFSRRLSAARTTGARVSSARCAPMPSDQHELSWDDVSPRVIEWMRIDVERVHWFSTYRVHHRVADQFRKGRTFLLGDAAHIHSPVGGQGMNTGIGDAVNLAWKIADVVHGRADASLLDSYRTRTHRLRPAPGRDDRSRVHGRDERRCHRPAHPAERRARRRSGGVFVQGRAALHVSHGLADIGALP